MQIKKLLLIALKDLRLIFRDTSALILMLLAPFILTLGMGALTGRFSGSSNTGISNIPVVIVNQDQGELGSALLDVFQLPELQDLVDLQVMDDYSAAQALVDEDQRAAVIYVPEGFTARILPGPDGISQGDTLQIEFYGNPTQPTSAGVLRSILDQFINQVQVGRISGEVIVSQLIDKGLIEPEQAAAVGAGIGQEMAQNASGSSAITIKTEKAAGTPIEFDILAYMAPGMAIMFLMFTVSYGGRSLLVENYNGTLPRLLVAPTTSAYVLGGKAFGILLTAIAQLLILIGGTSLMFRLQWGDALGVLVLILASAWGATGWGILFAAILKTPGQIAITGSAVMLLFGILGGSFFDLSMLPDWIQIVNKITPNAWAIDGFYILSVGGALQDIIPQIIALLVMGAVLFTFATLWITKRGLARK
jgi:ABC-2 type transport system permease protein